MADDAQTRLEAPTHIERLEYRSPGLADRANGQSGVTIAVQVFGVIVMVLGLLMWLMAFGGIDERDVVVSLTTFGTMFLGFGITWCFIGLVLRKLDERDD